MTHKIEFTNEIHINSGLMVTGNECFKHGITWGCTIDCPVLRNHKCELKESENEQLYQQFLEETN